MSIADELGNMSDIVGRVQELGCQVAEKLEEVEALRALETAELGKLGMGVAVLQKEIERIKR